MPSRFFMRLLSRQSGLKPFNLAFQSNASWHERAEVAATLAARLIARPGDHPFAVADVGCGDQKLKRFLLAHWPNRLIYDGYDIHPQSPDVVSFDVSTNDLARSYDVVFVLGVLEYIDDPPAILSKLLKSSRLVCASITLRDHLKTSPNPDGRRAWRYLPTLHQWREDIAASSSHIVEMMTVDDGQVAVTMVQR